MSLFDSLLSGLGGKVVPKSKGIVVGVDSGGSNTGLTQEEEGAIVRVIGAYNDEDYWTQRYEGRRKYRCNEYYRGVQSVPGDAYAYGQNSPFGVTQNGNWANNTQNIGDGESGFTINIYRPYGLSVISVLTGSVPGVRFYPEDNDTAADVKMARAANAVADMFTQHNELSAIQTQMALHMWNDGIGGLYVTYREDAQRFGTHQKPIEGMVPQEIPGTPPYHECQQCGAQAPPDAPQCQQCGQWLGAHTLQPGTPPSVIEVPGVVGYETVANGTEVVEAVPGLELRVTPEAKSQSEYTYLIRATDVDVAVAWAMYPDKMDEIKSGMGQLSVLDEEARRDRLRLTSRVGGGGSQVTWGTPEPQKKVTLLSVWLRPTVFYRIEDEVMRKSFLERFPDGIFVRLAGRVVCEVRAESMDDHWYIYHAHPGDGQIRESIGDVLLDAQDVSNELLNQVIDTSRHSVPITFVDGKMVSLDAFRQNRVRGGLMFEVNRVDGNPISTGFHQMDAATANPQAMELQQYLVNDFAQFASGAGPALMGMGSSDLKTAAGYKMARDQSLGRVGIPWRAIKLAFRGMFTLAVRNFIKYRTSDAAFSKKMQGGFRNVTVRLADVSTGRAIAYCESDEAYPIDPADRRDVIQGMLTSPNPMIQASAADPDNLEMVMEALGPTGFVLAGARQREKQQREIEALLKAQPIMVMAPPDPMTGMPAIDLMTGMPAMVPAPSIPIDPVFDDHKAEFDTVQRWLWTEDAEEQKVMNPGGYENVRLHGIAHFTQFQAMSMAMMGGPPAPGVPAPPGMPPAPPPQGPPPPGPDGIGAPPAGLVNPGGPPPANLLKELG